MYPLVARAVTTPEPSVVVHTPGSALEATGGINKEAVTTVATTTPAPPRSAGVSAYNCGIRAGSWEDVQRMVEEEFGVGHVMVRIARAESRFDPEARNCSSTATGVFQILIGTFNDPRYQCTGERTNARDNIDCARKIYDIDGTRPWNASKGAWG